MGGAKEAMGLHQVLEESEKEEKHVDVQICPLCMSSRVRRVQSMGGDMSSHIGYLPPKFECIDCGWRGRLVVYTKEERVDLDNKEDRSIGMEVIIWLKLRKGMEEPRISSLRRPLLAWLSRVLLRMLPGR